MTSDQEIINRYNELISYKMNHEDVIYILRLMYELNFYWFERYISLYFHKTEWYITNDIWWNNYWGIDVVWLKKIWNKEYNLAIQCKKWTFEKIRAEQILVFDYKSKDREKYSSNAKRCFVSTSQITQEAKKVAKEYKINAIDCRDLLKMRQKYSLDDFEKDFEKNKYSHWTYKHDFFTKTNVISIIKNHISNIWFKYKPEKYLYQNKLYKKYHWNYNYI